MPTNDNNSSTDETPGQEPNGQQQQTTPEAGANGSQQQANDQQVTIDDNTQLPETHPLVKTLAKQKQDLANAKAALAEANAKAGKTSQLEQELQSRPSTEALETLQTRYDRLEAFLQAVGGPVSQALDSRSFTRDLFETDKDIATILKDWRKANPSATSNALGGNAQDQSNDKADMNTLLRAAAKG